MTSRERIEQLSKWLKEVKEKTNKPITNIYKELTSNGLNMTWWEFRHLYYGRGVAIEEKQEQIIIEYCNKTLGLEAEAEKATKLEEADKKTEIEISLATAPGVFIHHYTLEVTAKDTHALLGYGISKSGHIFRVASMFEKTYLIYGNYDSDFAIMFNQIDFNKFLKALKMLGWVIL
jgi:hypothetical protein